MLHKKIGIAIIALMLASSIGAYQEESVLDALFQTSTRHLFNLGKDNILLWLAHQHERLAYRTTYPFSTITLAGFYRLASQVTGAIGITVSNVTLDLNGNTVMGGITISSGLSNVTIKNGVVDMSTASLDVIIVNSGCSLITIDNVLVKSGTRGINLIAAHECVVSNCEMTLNTTGIEINTCHNIVVKNCTASQNSLTGFGLLTSTTCSITGCRALGTGFGNTQKANTTICGFFTSNGSANLFDACISNGTQALTTTDFNSVIAGFAITGTEQLSYITNSQASNTSTLSSGVTIPYGIFLQGTLGGLTSLTLVSTGSNSDSVQALSWTSDASYLAVGGTLTRAPLQIYQLNPQTNSLTLTSTYSFALTTTVFSAPFSPDNRYLAVGGALQGTDLSILQFIPDNQSLVQVASAIGSASDVVYATAWSPDGNYIALGGSITGNNFQVYLMDRVNLSLTQTIDLNIGATGNTVRAVAWSPDGRFLAAGGTTTVGNQLQLYYFNQGTVQLASIASVNFSTNSVLSIAWSPDGTYLAVGIGFAPTNSLNLYRFSLISTVYTLTPITAVLGDTSVYSLSWSPDGRFLAVGGLFSTNDLNVYFFDRGTLQLNLLQSASPGGTGSTMHAAQWSPDGTYLAIGGLIQGAITYTLYLIQALQFPTNNVISNNIISNNSGALFPFGIGVSGSSIVNYIVGNMSYNNPNTPWMVYTNYAGVCNVFNQIFFQVPTLLQNLQGSSTNLLPTPDDFNTRMGRVLSMADDIQTKVNFLLLQPL